MNIEDNIELTAYLHQRGLIYPDDMLTIQVLHGGVSNRTVSVQVAGGDHWVLKQALQKLRVKVDWYSDPTRIHNEAKGMRWLAELTPPGTIPAMIFVDQHYHVLCMKAVPDGHRNWKDMLLAGQVQQDHVRQFAAVLAQIHRESYRQQQALKPLFGDRRFFENLRLEPYYSYTSEQHTSTREFFESLMNETRQQSLALVHGDYSPKNILIHENKLILLDHEVIHFGDPAFDVGFSMTHLLSKAHHVAAARPAFLSAAQFYWQHYQHHVGPLAGDIALEERAIRHTLACMLARVDGRSPMPYLTASERSVQRTATLHLITQPPTSMTDLIAAFGEEF